MTLATLERIGQSTQGGGYSVSPGRLIAFDDDSLMHLG